MIQRPAEYIPRFLPFASSITTHLEADHDVSESLAGVRAAGLLAGLAISPATAVEDVRPYLGQFDILLVMTVVPGFGGQAFLPAMLDKIRLAAGWRDSEDLDFEIEVDGGINAATAAESVAAGANLLVAGTSIFRAADVSGEIDRLRKV
jgi:ribulose-phosphate 3-epimerase